MTTLKNGGTKTMKPVIIVAITAILIGCLVGTCIFHFNKYTTASTAYILDLRKQVDSLQTELFIERTNIGRYEMALELLKSEDSLAAKQFENQLNQTE
jgi:uncharacterized protein YlxW (UPF0749 family)